MHTQRKRLLSKVGFMYYVENRSQNEIAKELEINRTTVSRMIKQVQKEKMVEITIHDIPEAIFKLESELQQVFGLQHIVVVENYAGESEKEKDMQLLSEAAYYLNRIIKSENIVGVTSGKTLATLTSLLKTNKDTDAIFVPLIGSPEKASFETHVNTIAHNLAKAFKGTSVFMNASLIQENEELKKQIQSAKNFTELNHYWNHLDISIAGIGNPYLENSSQWREILSPQEIEDLKTHQIVGDSYGFFFDIDGNILEDELYRKTIRIDQNCLAKVPHSLGIARGIGKVPAIIGAIRSKNINTLITDQETAQELLRTINPAN